MLMLISNGFLLFFGNIAVVALVILRMGKHIVDFAQGIVLFTYRISVSAILLPDIKGFLSGHGVFHIKVADVAADVVGTVDKTGIFKDVYSATTAAAGNAGEVMAGNMTAAEAVAKTAVEASTEIIKNRAQSTGAKFAANILGDSAQDATSAMLEGKDLGEVTDAAIAGAGRGLLDSTVDYAISTGNKVAASSGRQSLTDAGETLASDLAKSALPKVEVPKKKE